MWLSTFKGNILPLSSGSYFYPVAGDSRFLEGNGKHNPEELLSSRRRWKRTMTL
jgi:hypothetical protein